MPSSDDDLGLTSVQHGSAQLAMFFGGMVLALLATPARGLWRTIVHAVHHPGCVH